MFDAYKQSGPEKALSRHDGCLAGAGGVEQEVVMLPPDVEVQPISEGQFAAVIQGFDTRQNGEGSYVYTRKDHPWQYLRRGKYVLVRHRHEPLPPRHYLIV